MKNETEVVSGTADGNRTQRTQDQDHQRVDTVMRRVEAMERSKDSEATKPRIDDLAARVQRMEHRLAKLEETSSQLSARLDSSGEPRTSKPIKPTQSAEPMATGITPTSAFNLAYNDYLNGKYELAVAGFQRFIKDFSGTSLATSRLSSISFQLSAMNCSWDSLSERSL